MYDMSPVTCHQRQQPQHSPPPANSPTTHSGQLFLLVWVPAHLPKKPKIFKIQIIIQTFPFILGLAFEQYPLQTKVSSLHWIGSRPMVQTHQQYSYSGFSRFGPSQGLLYKHLRNSFIHSFIH